MTMFTIRVELHGAQAHHYASLAQKLAQFGVIDIITSDDGRKWKLPPAEYTYTGNSTLEQVLDAVQGAADAVIASNAVFVTKADSRMWKGLKQVVSA